jgi:glycosyltransferase involved in cell wall biosynthesis
VEENVDDALLKVALIGTRGVPARYGGFETAVEQIGSRLAYRGHRVIVFCRPPADGTSERPPSYKGMDLVHLPAMRRRSLETLSHTALSVINPVLRGVDSAILFNAANSPLLPVLRARRIPTATHVDGIEWKRAKWQGAGRYYYRAAEAVAVKLSDALIADARGIAEYYREEFGADTREIAYGAPVIDSPRTDKLAGIGLEPRRFHLVVARFEPENHILEIVEGYRRSGSLLPLVVAGAAPYSPDYTQSVHEAAGEADVRFIGSVWDQELLNQLYANCASYLHGHSVGGTNPSLLRASGAGAAVIAYDVVFNREVLDGNGLFFSDPDGVATALATVREDPRAAWGMGERLRADIGPRYDWDDVTDRYEELLRDLHRVGVTRLRSHPSGRRRGTN